MAHRGPLGLPRPFGIGPFTKPQRVKPQSRGEVERAIQRIRDRMVEAAENRVNRDAADDVADNFAEHGADIVNAVVSEDCWHLRTDMARLLKGIENDIDFQARNDPMVDDEDEVVMELTSKLMYDYYPTLANAAGCDTSIFKIVDEDKFERERQFAPDITNVARL